ncbi:hypothetical protein AMJ96_PD00353 (plasmid) [Rhizobium sp. N113]|nr:hypothetical protein AMJ96_PD00353 [Rhizobium sp. N113]
MCDQAALGALAHGPAVSSGVPSFPCFRQGHWQQWMVQHVECRVRTFYAFLLALCGADENRILPNQVEIELDDVSHDMIQNGLSGGGPASVSERPAPARVTKRMAGPRGEPWSDRCFVVYVASPLPVERRHGTVVPVRRGTPAYCHRLLEQCPPRLVICATGECRSSRRIR